MFFENFGQEAKIWFEKSEMNLEKIVGTQIYMAKWTLIQVWAPLLRNNLCLNQLPDWTLCSSPWWLLQFYKSLFYVSWNKNIGATIHIGRQIWCLPYAGFKKKIFSQNITKWMIK